MKAILEREIGIEEYLNWSTAIAAVAFVFVTESVQIGYLVVVANSLLLLALNRLHVHRNHLVAICILAAFSLIGSHLAGTPVKATIVQILGISILSIYFFNALATFGVSTERWMDMYMRISFAVTIFSILVWPIQRKFSFGDPRLHSVFREPSFFIYVMLPALGYCFNRYVSEKRYGVETLVFLLAFGMTDSSLGYMGILLIGLITLAPRLKGWQLIVGGLLTCLMVASIFVASINFRTRAVEMVTAISKQDLSGTGASSFAVLSNVYVASQSFLEHPFTGVGLGGYAGQYDKYFGDLTGTELALPGSGLAYFQSLELNRDDASSMFLRAAAELGVPGLMLLFGFLIICARVRGRPYIIIRNALLPYLIIRMARFGAYFSAELYFFVGLYVLNYLHYHSTRQISVQTRLTHGTQSA